jgi:hypothetical protein
MGADRYLKFILTIMAVELLWLGLKEAAPSVAAQSPTRVTITAIELEPGSTGYLPVGLVGTYREVPARANDTLERVRVQISEPIAVHAPRPLRIEADRPLTIQVDRPLPVQAVREPGSQRPGG